MNSLSDDIQSHIIEAFNSISRYLDNLMNIDNPYFEGMVNQIYSPVARFTERLITYLSPKTYLTTHLRPTLRYCYNMS